MKAHLIMGFLHFGVLQMKWIYLILSNIMMQLLDPNAREMLNPIEEFKTLIKQNIAKIILVFVSLTAVVAFFVSGFIIVAINYAFQFDLKQNLHMNAVTAFGATLMVVSFILIMSTILFIKKGHHHNKHHEAEMKKHQPANPIQDAIALLINDYVTERESERENKRTHIKKQHEFKDDFKEESSGAQQAQRQSEVFERH